jgi:hypothetical protein
MVDQESSVRPRSPGSGSILKDKDGALYVPSSVNTPPPGFALPDTALFHGTNISRSAAASAPPTSLFGTEQFLNLRGAFNNDRERAPRIRQIPSLDVNNLTLGDADPIFAKSRTMSYDNLAMALGEGLAECMGDSLNENNKQSQTLKLDGLSRSR